MHMEQNVTLHTLRNAHGLRAEITNLGGRVVSLFVPDRNGIPRDVVLGFENVEDYLPENHRSDFGAAIGRYANRLNNGQITIDGKTYQLPQNDGKNCLHGGPDGWQYRIFNVEEMGDNRLVLSLVSEDGDSGFPGNVCARVTYMLTDDNALDIQYEAVTDEPTVINMTNHSRHPQPPADHRRRPLHPDWRNLHPHGRVGFRGGHADGLPAAQADWPRHRRRLRTAAHRVRI